MADPVVPVVPAVKPAWQSKTLWTNLILAAAAIFAPAGLQQWMADNQTALPLLFAVVNMVLRFATTSGIQLSDS